MKVLTIKQPWASLITNGYKLYEFRSWKTKYRGKILIHAGMSIEKKQLDKFKDYNLDIINGAIIGEAELVDCILVDKKFDSVLKKANRKVYGNSGHVQKYAWKLTNVRKYDIPISIKGKLGLWNFEVNK